MKTLADTICKSTNPEVAIHRSLLIMPDLNHSPQEMCAKFDRYILMRDAATAVGDEYRWRKKENNLLLPFSQPRPAKNGFIEVHFDTGPIGYMWRENAPDTLFVVSCNSDMDAARFLVHSVKCLATGVFSTEGSSNVDQQKVVSGFEIALTLINSPRSATVEKTVPRWGVGAQRRAQRGLPMFSFNTVRLNRDCASIQRHETILSENQGTVRAHNVRGHWRLIVPGPTEAYWTWVDGFVAGNRDLGFVVKQHVVGAKAPQMVRRGFAVPNKDGNVGQRIPAQRIN